MNTTQFLGLFFLSFAAGAFPAAQAQEHPAKTEHPAKAGLAGLLAYHVVPGKIMAADMKTMKAANVSGQDLSIQVGDGMVTVNQVRVVRADLEATNGVIHAIDAVMIPAPPVDKAVSEKPKDHPAH